MTAKRSATILFGGAAILLILFLLSGEALLSAGREAALLVSRAILPSLFPYLVLSGILSSTAASIRLPGGRLFSRVFGLPSEGLVAFLLGALCGFPIGVKMSAELYREGVVNREEGVKLACLSANTGPAFAVAGIGGALFGDTALGWRLYLLQLTTAVLLGLLTRGRGGSESKRKEKHTAPLPALSELLYRASLTMLGIAGTVLFFSTLSSLLSYRLSPLLTALLTAPLEVGSAAAAASRLTPALALPILAFSLSFSGVSVLLQSAALLEPVGLPTTPLVRHKLLHGLLSAFLATLVL